MTERSGDNVQQRHFLSKDLFGELFSVLREQGYQVIGPVEVAGVVMLRPIERVEQIARGLTDDQQPASYRTVPADQRMWFDYVVGPESGKHYLFPAFQQLFTGQRQTEGYWLNPPTESTTRYALFGLRPCDLAALKVYDRVFAAAGCGGESYAEARKRSLTLVINCTRPGGCCFCVSMGTGPAASDGFDLAFTELGEGFVVHVGSAAGQQIAGLLPIRNVSAAESELADLKIQRACDHMGRTLNTQGIVELLDATIDHAEWDRVAERCLSCGNCTMVCPTCFCSTASDATNLSGAEFTRTRQWESCFTHEFSYTVAGPVRNTIRGRYRHWLRHKLGTWHEQFGCSGCVGCGRCIVWCPVGIDLTQQIEALRDKPITPLWPVPVKTPGVKEPA